MPWFYVDDGFSDSKPVMSLPTTPVRVPMRIAAVGAWVLGGSWSAKEELDGYIPHAKLRSLLVPRSVAAALCSPGSLDAALCCPDTDGILVKNWAKWQPTKAELVAKRKREAEKKRNQRRRGRNFVTGIDDQVSPGDMDQEADLDDEDSKDASPGDSPSPTPPHPIVVTETSVGPVGGVPPTAHTADPPSRFCDLHPNGTRKRCGDCGNARHARKAWDERQAELAGAQDAADAEARRSAAAIRDACQLCDENGLTNTEPVRRCTHPVVQLEAV